MGGRAGGMHSRMGPCRGLAEVQVGHLAILNQLALHAKGQVAELIQDLCTYAKSHDVVPR
jgi:hypothetical protein